MIQPRHAMHLPAAPLPTFLMFAALVIASCPAPGT